MKQQIGVIGLGVMGTNLALNMESKGFSVAVYDYWTERVDELSAKEAQGKNIQGAYSIEEFVSSLETPRKILMMVQAGDTTDSVIESLIPHLEKGDILMDGGNSFFQDTNRRTAAIEAAGLHFIGAGISGGEEGARNGPSIMPGGSKEAYGHVQPLLDAISAKVDGVPCSTYMGPLGAGHYVKMVHNGIEYGDMQLISEAYFIMKQAFGLSAQDMHGIFAEWNKGELDSYLIEITADILAKKMTKPAIRCSTRCSMQPNKKAPGNGQAKTHWTWASPCRSSPNRSLPASSRPSRTSAWRQASY